MRAALIAVALALLALAAAPAARAETIVGVSANHIFSFESESPEVVERLTKVTGMPDGFFLGALDFRPATGELYAVADQASSLKALFKIDLASGQATQVGEKFQMAGQRTALSMAFNPATDRVRVASGAQKMVSIHPDTGVVLPLTDTSKPLGALAYSGGALYGYVTRDIPEKRGLYQVDQVNGTVAPRLGAEFPFNQPLQLDYAGLDFSPTGNLGYLSFVTSGEAAHLYAVNLPLATGSRTFLGSTPLTPSSIAVVASRPLELTASFVSVDEGAGSATLTVQRAEPSPGHARVNYSTFDGSATAGSDYTNTSGTVTFAPNQTSATFTVPIAADSADERGETFGVRLSRPVGGFLGERYEAAVTIVDPPVTTGGGGGGTGGTGGGGTGGGGTGGGGTAPPDTSAPVVLLAARERSRIRRPIAVRYSCSEACTTALELIVDSKTQKRFRLKSRTLGTATAALTAAGKGSASVKITRAALKRLKRARRVKAKLRATSTDAAGNRTLQAANVLLVR